MDGNCKDCPYILSVQKDIGDLKENIKEIDQRLQEVEKTGAARDEQIKTIFNILREIKDSVKEIADKIEKIQLKPDTNADKLKWIVITASCSSVVGVVVGFFILK